MDTVRKLIILFILFPLFPLLYCCNGPHREQDVEFLIRNGLDTPISWNSYNLNNGGFPDFIVIEPNEVFFTGGGGIVGVDSVIFVKQATEDTIVYRSASHGDVIANARHFLNVSNWREEEYNKFYYTVREEDFER